jgi:hypothetical protein
VRYHRANFGRGLFRASVLLRQRGWHLTEQALRLDVLAVGRKRFGRRRLACERGDRDRNGCA